MHDADRDWTIRPARDGEHRDARALAPSLFTERSQPDLMLVAIGGAARVVGVAGVAWRAWGRPPGFPVHVEVDPAERRRGIGRALLDAAAAGCVGETRWLHPWGAVEPGTVAEAFVRSTGFEFRRRLLHFEGDGARFIPMIAALRRRLQARSRDARGLAVVPLADVPPAEVAALVTDAMGSDYARTLASVDGRAPSSVDRGDSVALLHEGRVRGVFLFGWGDDAVADVVVNVVAPELRHGPAELLLLEGAAQRFVAAGRSRFRFRCEDRVIDSVSLGRRADARMVRTVLEFTRPLPAA